MKEMTPEEAKAIISENIRRILKERGMSVYALVQLVKNEPANTVYRVVRGENEPGAAVLANIAAALNVKVDALLPAKKKLQNSA